MVLVLPTDIVYLRKKKLHLFYVHNLFLSSHDLEGSGTWLQVPYILKNWWSQTAVETDWCQKCLGEARVCLTAAESQQLPLLGAIIMTNWGGHQNLLVLGGRRMHILLSVSSRPSPDFPLYDQKQGFDISCLLKSKLFINFFCPEVGRQ